MGDRRARGNWGVACLVALAVATAAPAASDEPPLVEAAKHRDWQQVRALLTRAADVNVRSGDGATALLWASHWNDVETARLLIAAGAHVDAANDLRITPLSLACTNGNARLVDLLLKSGGSPHTPIATGELPVMTCAASGSEEAVRLLASHMEPT